MNTTKLNVLMIEDSEDDAELLILELEDAGYILNSLRVETYEEMRKAITHQEWDLVLADDTLPHFNGLDALRLWIEMGDDKPFILVSGTIGEERAVEIMKEGANDYVMKHNLSRLVPAIKRELREADVRRKQRASEQALLESEEKYRTLVKSMHDIVFVYDENNCYSQYHALSSDLLYMMPEEFIGKHVSEVLPKEIALQIQKKLQQVRNTGESRTIDYPLAIQGKDYWFSANLSLHEDEKSAVAIVRDITDRKRAEEQAKQASEIAEFHLDLMSHDLRNHLMAVSLGTEILGAHSCGEEYDQVYSIINESVERSKNLIKKIVTTRNLFQEPILEMSLGKALEESLRKIREAHNDTQLDVNIIPEGNMIVKADVFLKHLLLNILENGVEHNNSESKHIWVEVNPHTEEYEVTIADNGPGIPDKLKVSLFDPERRFGGVGIHQAMKIVEKYGGFMSVKDRVLGDSSLGSKFCIRLPRPS